MGQAAEGEGGGVQVGEEGDGYAEGGGAAALGGEAGFVGQDGSPDGGFLVAQGREAAGILAYTWLFQGLIQKQLFFHEYAKTSSLMVDCFCIPSMLSPLYFAQILIVCRLIVFRILN